MNLAETKKRQNISEYIIYMYQTEDLIRIYEFDMEKIDAYVIKHIPAEASEKTAISTWYAKIAKQMQMEGLGERGHLAETQRYVNHLNKLKNDLLANDEGFKKIYDKAKTHIDESLQLSNGAVTNDVQACLNGVYGLLLARMNGKKVPAELMEGVNAFGDVLSYLSYKFNQRNYLEPN